MRPYLLKVMTQVLIYFIAGLFLALLFLNIFFRLKVIRVYKNMIKHRVEVNSVVIFEPESRMKDVFLKFPGSVADIKSFIYYIRLSVGIAVLIVLCITLLGLVLHFNR
ncbi:MAG: hypothetical protein IPL63_03385 [Saprospiraceae bacterium]|nr:hypothetical protein [Saprospiraceae bacterium]